MNYKQLGLRSAGAIAGIAFLIFLNNSCKNEGIPADQMPQICFTEQVYPIFQNSCATAGCHDATAQSGYDFRDTKAILDAVVAGSPDKSAAYQAMTSTFQLMPPKNPLSESKRAIIRLWIEQGALETCDGTKPAQTN